MSYPWQGARAPLPPDAFRRTAQALDCDTAAIRAVWQVEAGGRFYGTDGAVIHRFEPHHMPGSRMGWRDSLELGAAEREWRFLAAFGDQPERALRATSWGAPQIMGFNAQAAGHATAAAMVRAMADSEWAHLDAFVALVLSWQLSSAIRARDWLTFARRYNGSGQPEVYARRMERAYRRASGAPSPVVLRIGDRGAAVRRLQAALGIAEDGAFGPQTDRAVRAFQERAGLAVDGIAGARTWGALTAQRDAEPKPQPTCGLAAHAKGIMP